LIERLLWFSLPIFEYHERHRASSRITMPASAKAALHAHLYNALAKIIRDAASDVRIPSGSSATIPTDLLVQTIASTFVLVFNWWLEQRRSSAADADAIFRSLVVPSLAAL
jgi:hypothetical protein